jgi:hypothetical protein
MEKKLSSLLYPILALALLFSTPATVVAVLSAPTLSSPSNGSTTTDTKPYFYWSYVSGASWYQIQVDDYSSFSTPVIDTSSTYSYYTPTTALSTGIYYWRVRAIDSQGYAGYWSSTWSFTTTIGAPTLSSPSSGSTVSDTTPTFSWYSVSGADYYQIQVDDSSYFSSTAIDTTTYSASYTPTYSLSVGTYYWRVRGYDYSAGYCSWSSTWSFTIEVPSPTLCSPSNYSTVTDTKPTLDWYSVSGAYEYEIQIDDSSSFYSPSVSTSTYTDSYTPTTSLSSGTFYWHVRTKDYNSNYSSWSSTWSFTVSATITITFYDSDTKQPLKYKSIYISTDGWSWSYFDQTDSYGEITNTSFDYMGQTVYFRVEQGGEYDTTSIYTSTYGGSDSVYMPPSTATRIGRMLPGVLLAIIVIGVVVAGVVLIIKKGKTKVRPKPPVYPTLRRKPAPPALLKPEQLEAAVYKHIKRHHGELDVKEFAKKLGISEEEVEKATQALVAKGKLMEER